MKEQKEHGRLFKSLKMFYREWKISDAEELKSFIPYSITQEDYNEIVGVNSVTTSDTPGSNGMPVSRQDSQSISKSSTGLD